MDTNEVYEFIGELAIALFSKNSHGEKRKHPFLSSYTFESRKRLL